MKPASVSLEFAGWAGTNGVNTFNGKLVIAGKNFAAFDKSFLDVLPNWKERINRDHRIIDPGNMFYIPGVDDGPPDTAECLRRAKLPPVVNHKARDDAFDVVRLIRYRMKQEKTRV